MLSKRNTSDTSQTVQRGLCTQHLALFFQEPAGQGESGQCGPSGYTKPGPNSGSLPQV